MSHWLSVWIAIGVLAAATAISAAVRVPPDWSGLLADYRSYGLPFPPADAPPVTVDSGWSTMVDGKNIPMRSLAFLVEKGSEVKPATLLVGTETERPDRWSKVVTVTATADLAKEVSPNWMKPVFWINTGVPAAIQCKYRGWDGLADSLLTASLKVDCGHPYSPFHQPAGAAPRLALARVALAHWANELIRPESDRAMIAQHLEKLLGAFPELRNTANTALLKSLQSALVPSTAPAGSIDASIDALVDLPYRPRVGGDDEPDPRLLRLELLGFRAVPALIEHLDDERLTRTVKLGFNNFPTYHQQVGMVVSELLQQLAGADLGKDWLRRQQGWNVEKAAARAWWAKASKVGEEAYIVRHLRPSDPKDVWPNRTMLRILADRYPWRLGQAYRSVLRGRAGMQSWPVTETISRSTLPAAEKLLLFREGAANANLEHRRAALQELKSIDQTQFLEILLRSLEELPRTPKEPYWSCREAALAQLVLLTDDSHAWEVFQQVAKRSDVGLRMELLNPMDCSYLGEQRRTPRLRFLLSFLDDATFRDTRVHPEKWVGPYAGFNFPRLEVRNLAAMKAASLLRMAEKPQVSWKGAQWAEFRTAVRQALARELGGASDR